MKFNKKRLPLRQIAAGKGRRFLILRCPLVLPALPASGAWCESFLCPWGTAVLLQFLPDQSTGKLFPRHNLVAERAETAGKGVAEFKISVLRNVKYLRNWIFTHDKVPLLPDVVSPESVVPDPVQRPPEAAVKRHPAV